MSFRRFFRRSQWDEERRRELDAYIAIETDEQVARGLTPEDARAAARRKLGNATLVREEIYQMNTIGWVDSVWQDLRYGARLLRRDPGFAAVALLSLALGIGANAAIFQLLDVVRLRTLPIDHPEQMVEIRMAPSKSGRTGDFQGARPALTNPLWEQIRDREEPVSDLFAYGTSTFDLSTGGESHRVEGLFVSGGFFQALEGQPIRGRLIGAADDSRGCALPGAVLSAGFWQKEYGGAPDIVGRTVRVDGKVLPIIGVVSSRFSGIEVGRRSDVILPICARAIVRPDEPGIETRDLWWLAAFGRLKPGVTLDQASAELAAHSAAFEATTVSARYSAEDAADYLGLRLAAYPAATGVSGLRARYSTSLTVLLGIAALVLLVACANLATLMLARVSTRTREIAVRLAIGASRRRVFRQLLAESLLLASIGAAAGIWLALTLSRVLVSILTSDGSPWSLDLALDWRLVGFTIGLAIVACVVFGLAPAIRATRTAPGAVLKASGRGLTADRTRFLLRRLLVVGQVAVSLVLVIGAWLFVTTLRNLAASDLGFSDRDVFIADLDLRPAGVAPEAQLALHSRVIERLRAVPGVKDATSAAIVPLGGAYWNRTLFVDGVKQKSFPAANRVDSDFFRTLQVPFVAGRAFDERDRLDAPPVTIVDEAFVAEYLPGANPIGRRFTLDSPPGRPSPSYEVIGVVKNTKYSDLRQPFGPIMYFASTQDPNPDPYLQVLVRSDRGATVRADLLAAVADIHPGIVVTMRTLRDEIQGTLLRERLMAALSGGFAALAVVLAAVGLYGLMSYGVARRRNEIGVRVALGATRGGIIGMIVGETTMLVAVGVAVGLGLAIWSAHAAEALLYGLTPSDPRSLVGGVLVLAVVAVVAGIVPAHRAAGLDPVTALRDEV